MTHVPVGHIIADGSLGSGVCPKQAQHKTLNNNWTLNKNKLDELYARLAKCRRKEVQEKSCFVGLKPLEHFLKL